MDMRLKTMPYEIDGKNLTLSCNMNVLAELQEEYGDLMQFLETNRTMRSFLQLLAAMINDALDADGSDVRYTPDQLGRKLGWKEFRRCGTQVFDLFISSVIIPDSDCSSATLNDEKKDAASEAERTV